MWKNVFKIPDTTALKWTLIGISKYGILKIAGIFYIELATYSDYFEIQDEILENINIRDTQVNFLLQSYIWMNIFIIQSLPFIPPIYSYYKQIRQSVEKEKSHPKIRVISALSYLSLLLNCYKYIVMGREQLFSFPPWKLRWKRYISLLYYTKSAYSQRISWFIW